MINRYAKEGTANVCNSKGIAMDKVAGYYGVLRDDINCPEVLYKPPSSSTWFIDKEDRGVTATSTGNE